MEKIIPEIIFKNEKIEFYKIVNKNKHILISENNIKYYRKEIMNDGFDIFCDECGLKTNLKNIPNIKKIFLCKKCRTKGGRNGMFNKKLSIEARNKIREKNTGRKTSEETKLKLHYALLGKNKGKYDGKNNPMYNKKVYDIWVEKYGEEEANNKNIKYKNKISNKTSGKNNPMYNKKVYDIWVEKYGEEEADKKWKIYLEKLSKTSYFRTYNKQNNKNWSNISQELFWKIYSEIYEKYKKIYFGELNHEYSCGIRSKNFDFVIKDNKKIIEFNGDKWHANPKLYEEKDIPFDFIGLTAKEIWENDIEKNKMAQENGYEVLIVWEKDYKDNPEKEIKKCLNFINNEKF
jgi:very-short-patch-repair endonuclease